MDMGKWTTVDSAFCHHLSGRFVAISLPVFLATSRIPVHSHHSNNFPSFYRLITSLQPSHNNRADFGHFTHKSLHHQTQEHTTQPWQT